MITRLLFLETESSSDIRGGFLHLPTWLAIALWPGIPRAVDIQSEQYSYKLFDAPAATATYPASINSRGQVTGSYYDAASTQHGFLYSGGTFLALDVPGATRTEPLQINAHGHVTGSYNDGFKDLGFIYNNGDFSTLEFPGAAGTYPESINSRGQVAGYYLDVASDSHGFLFSDGTYTTLDASGALTTSANSINDLGQVAGLYFIPSSPFPKEGKVFIYSGGTFTTIVSLAPVPEEKDVAAINNAGEVIGTECFPPGHPGYYNCRGFLFSQGTVTYPPISFLTGLNASGQIVGYRRYAYDMGADGYLYSEGNSTSLNVPDFSNTYPISINDSGQVAGYCLNYWRRTGNHGFIATPVVAVLDDFNRDDGGLGPHWTGRTRREAYQVVNHRVEVGVGGPTYWQPNPFGLDQEAFVTLTQIDPAGLEQGLLLKVQGEPAKYRNGAIAVKYDAKHSAIRVATWRKAKSSWRNYRDIPVALADGDKLGARVLGTSKVKIYRNDQLLGVVTLAAADRKFFNSRIGRIGLWFKNAPNATVEDFGGGTHME